MSAVEKDLSRSHLSQDACCRYGLLHVRADIACTPAMVTIRLLLAIHVQRSIRTSNVTTSAEGKCRHSCALLLLRPQPPAQARRPCVQHRVSNVARSRSSWGPRSLLGP